MLKMLNLYLKGVMRGRQELADFWNKTLKFASLEVPHSQMKAAILPLLFFPLAWLELAYRQFHMQGLEHGREVTEHLLCRFWPTYKVS